jgi:uncharacterized heparinase superfamily protein
LADQTRWDRIRRSALRQILRLIWHRARRHLSRSPLRPARWDAPPPNLARLRALVPLPTSSAPIIAVADGACAGRFTLLGFPAFDLGHPPDWHADPHSGHRWDSAAPAPTLDLMTRDSPADVRVVWELNRFHHAVTLGMAWRQTHDERYPAAFASQVTDWLAANPVGRGVNWACAMEAAIRAVNWLFAYALMQEALPAGFARALLGALLTHGRFVRAHLELALVTTNHYLVDLCGLAVLGLALPGAEPDRWRRFALRELAREVAFQVYPDGGSFEASTGYHRLATELVDLPLRLAQDARVPVPPILPARLQRMRAFAAAVARPDGTLPLIGDSDDGHLLPACAFPSPPVPAASSSAFPRAGIYVMRHGDYCLMCDCGPNGQRGNGGHAHNDTLSFELYAGRPWIVDPGTYSYTGDLAAYNWFRSTAAHNTLVVDGEEQARFDPREPFLLAPDAVPTVHRWESQSEYDLLDAEHAGYRRLPAPVTHRRQILFDKRRRLWLIRDVVAGQGTHSLDWRFHLVPLPIAGDEFATGAVRARAPDGVDLLLAPLQGPALDLTIEEGWVSYRYGRRERAPVVRYTAGEVALPVTVTFALVPAPGPLPGTQVAECVGRSLAMWEMFS